MFYKPENNLPLPKAIKLYNPMSLLHVVSLSAGEFIITTNPKQVKSSELLGKCDHKVL